MACLRRCLITIRSPRGRQNTSRYPLSASPTARNFAYAWLLGQISRQGSACAGILHLSQAQESPWVRCSFIPSFDSSWITASHHFRADYAQPVVTVGYREHIPPLRAPVPGLYLCSMAQVYPEDRGMNYAVVYGEKAAEAVIQDIQTDTINS